MSAPIDLVLARLDKVRSSGAGRWAACCPAHNDKSPSLNLRELDDGRLLLHCHAGCDVHSIVAAMGLEMTDLYPERTATSGAPRERRPWNASDLLRLAAFESTVCVLITADMAAGRTADRSRLLEAASCLQRIVEAVDGQA